jgi:hypothetical protein
MSLVVVAVVAVVILAPWRCSFWRSQKEKKSFRIAELLVEKMIGIFNWFEFKTPPWKRIRFFFKCTSMAFFLPCPLCPWRPFLFRLSKVLNQSADQLSIEQQTRSTTAADGLFFLNGNTRSISNYSDGHYYTFHSKQRFYIDILARNRCNAAWIIAGLSSKADGIILSSTRQQQQQQHSTSQ